LSWSSGKDSAWALHVLRETPDVEVVGLMTTMNEVHQRVAIHAVRLELLQRQAEALGLPVQVIELPSPCTNAQYEAAMGKFVDESKRRGIECMAFGDLFLADIKEYRETKLAGTGITPLFPLWLAPTDRLATEMISSGLRAVVTCVDAQQLPLSFAGRDFDEQFLADLPNYVDPCGERGEFHTFAFDGPMFAKPVGFQKGVVVERDGFGYADLLPACSTVPGKIDLAPHT
jgi:uncharacterized protein (TIGR00290 family)